MNMCLDFFLTSKCVFSVFGEDWVDLSTTQQSNKHWLLTGLQFTSRQSWIFCFRMQKHVPKAAPTIREPCRPASVWTSHHPELVFQRTECCSLLHWLCYVYLWLCVCVWERRDDTFFGFHIRESLLSAQWGNESNTSWPFFCAVVSL